MKLGPVTKFDKGNKAPSNIFSDLWPVWRRIVKLIFSSIVTFYLTKTENRTKKSLTQLSQNCFKLLFLPKNADFLLKNADISKSKWALIL